MRLGSQQLDRVMHHPEVHTHLAQYRETNREYDVPRLAGMSRDGTKVYLDRDLPEHLDAEQDGRTARFDMHRMLAGWEGREPLAWCLMEAMGWTHGEVDRLVEQAERRRILEQHGPQWWVPYQDAMARYRKGPGRLEKLPPDLDMRPYLEEPVNGALVDRMHELLDVDDGKMTKAEAKYERVGTPAEHCGPRSGWPVRGECRNYLGSLRCMVVRGMISPGAWCQEWTRR